ncbi:hypothetical protein EJB05_10397 [Eragrostis curvula]|uniref:S1 motif domain-containing protein n=1 Tax=Eragrostis curvula TaxID=38414 RepID=A0A5J9VNT2_9POAL|nr:hypothetical protein EJB05_10397 [Eragrostis curvula]
MDCRMYEAEFPEVDEAVMIEVQQITEQSVYVSLLEYGNIQGMILHAELSRRRMRSLTSLVRVGRQEPAIVLRVDPDKGYVDLSKRRVSDDDARACLDRYNKSKLVHSIMRHVADTLALDLDTLYLNVAWPLYRQYGHAFDAFKLLIVSDDDDPAAADAVLLATTCDTEVKETLLKIVRRRMTPQPLKIRADVEMKCFHYDGVLHIKEAMRKAEAAGNKMDCPVKMKLVAAPLYILTTQTLDKEKGISALNNAVKACSKAIEKHKGKLVVKIPPRAVSEREDKQLLESFENLKMSSSATDADDEDDQEEEDTGMGHYHRHPY